MLKTQIKNEQWVGDTSIKNSKRFLKQLHFISFIGSYSFPCRKGFLSKLHYFHSPTGNPEAISTTLKSAHFPRSCLCLQTLLFLLLGTLLPLAQICSGRSESQQQLPTSPAVCIPKEMFLWPRSNSSSSCLIFPPSLCFSLQQRSVPFISYKPRSKSKQ